MKKILMILTSHRLDCFKLCMDMLIHGGSIRRFDHVVLLLNGVKGRHLRHVHHLLAAHPDIPWDIIAGPRGRGRFISNLQNECVRRYPEALYFKIDEDTFVSADWDRILTEAYEAHRDRPDLALVTATIPNNGLGCWQLLNIFPELRDEYMKMPQAAHTPSLDGPIAFHPHLAEWMTREFLVLDEANRRVRAQTTEKWVPFQERFSINCICYDYRHWLEIGGVQEQDEVGWGIWIAENKKLIVLATQAVVHHYTFFCQQGWLDRSALLEDLRIANLPTSAWQRSVLGRALPRAVRICRHIPDILKRRLSTRKKTCAFPPPAP
jgi:hypothetical protein